MDPHCVLLLIELLYYVIIVTIIRSLPEVNFIRDGISSS